MFIYIFIAGRVVHFNREKDQGCVGLLGELIIESDMGVWIGEAPPYLKSFIAETMTEEVSIIPSHLSKTNLDTPSIEDIASFQVPIVIFEVMLL